MMKTRLLLIKLTQIKVKQRLKKSYLLLLILLLPFVVNAQFGTGVYTTATYLNRQYVIYTPKGLKAGKKYPLIVALHGDCNIASTMPMCSTLDKTADACPEKDKFRVLYLNGSLSNSYCNGTSPFNNSHWKDDSDVNYDSKIANANATSLYIFDILIKLNTPSFNNYLNYDYSKIYMVGHSYGAFLALYIASNASLLHNMIAGFASVAGSANENATLTKPVFPVSQRRPILLMNGTKDYLITYNKTCENLGAENLFKQMTRINGGTNFNQLPTPIIGSAVNPTLNDGVYSMVYSKNIANSRVVLWKVIGQGHLWPGNNFMSYDPSGMGDAHVTMSFDAGVVIWNFLKQFTQTYPIFNFSLRSESDDDEIQITPESVSEKFEMELFPNPTTNIVNVKFNTPLNNGLEVIVTDLLGNIILEKCSSHLIDQTSLMIDASNWPSGTYFLKYNYENHSEVKRFIKK